MRGVVTSIASVPTVRSFFERGPGRALAARFVAGETLPEALTVAGALVSQGFRVALDHLGESVATVDEARAAARVYRDTIQQVSIAEIPLSLSIKPSQFGLDLSADLCADLVESVARDAARATIGVRLDMEDSRRTDGTLRVWRMLNERGARVGVVLQAALRRSPADLEEILAAGGSVRLCKGAYAEPSTVAYPRKVDVDRAYEQMLERLLSHAASAAGSRPGFLPIAAIATHDERLIRRAIELTRQLRVPLKSYELQMLFGVRRDLQQAFLTRGYPVRIYAPWGQSWYPYLSRRLAERPANLAFVATAIVKDYLGSRGSRPGPGEPGDSSSRRMVARARR
jgi:proline dehydrogenase